MKNKFVKGVLAIFIVKLLFVGVLFLVQSCQVDEEIFENSERQMALEKFESLFRTSMPRIQSITENRNNLLFSKTDNNDYHSQSEQEAREVMMPIVQGAKELLQQYGINEIDLAEKFGTSDDPRTAILGLMTLRIEQLSIRDNQMISIGNILFTPLYAQSNLEIVDCALSALGLPAGLVLGTAKNLGTKAILKAASKLAGRAVGWVGLGIAAYQFYRCIDGLAILDGNIIDFQFQHLTTIKDEMDRFNC